MTEIAEIWEKVTRQLSEEISAVSFDTWIKPVSVVAADDNKITLEAPSTTVRTMLLTRYSSLITDSLENATSRKYTVEVVVSESNRGFRHSAPESKLLSENTLNPKYTFDSFVVGTNNILAHNAALAVAEQANVYNPLYIYGGSGLGKTHLLQAIGNYYSEHYPEKKLLYTTTEKFTYEFVTAIQNKKAYDFKHKYRTAHFL